MIKGWGVPGWVGRQPSPRALGELALQLAGPEHDIGAVACDWRIMTLILTFK